MCILLGLSEPIIAGPRDVQNPQSNSEEGTPNTDEEQAAAIPTLDDEIGIDERVRLHQALDAYSRSSDPENYSQLEQRRRIMRKQIQVRFFGADSDNDGTLSRDESDESLPQIARHFDEIDTNSDDIITMKELKDAQDRTAERRRAAEARIEEARLNQVKEAEAQLKRKNRQAANGRKRAL